MKQKKMIAPDECVKKALSILERFSPKELLSSDGLVAGRADPNEQLLQRLNFLLDDRRNVLAKLERTEKELAVFRNVNAETNRMLEKKIEELSLLRLITDTTSRAFMSHDPFKPILDKVLSIVGADSGFVNVLNPETKAFEVKTAAGKNQDDAGEVLSVALEHFKNFRASDCQSLRINDIRTDPRFAESSGERSGIRSLASFPLVVEEENIGVLTVCNQYPDAFDAETERIMHIIAGQIAVTVQNALLYGEAKKTKEYLENLVERAGDAIFTLDRLHTIVSWNKGAESIFRRDKTEVVGRPVYDVVSSGSAASLKEYMNGILHSENIVTTEVDTACQNGEATKIALTLSPIRGADGDVIGISGIAKDITEHMRVEEELRQLNEAKSQFVSTVSHELRTPLTSIKSYVEILLHEVNALPEDTILRYLIIMNEECDRLSGLITGVLDLQKLEAGMSEAKLEPLVFAEIVRQATDLFSGIAIPNRIELNTEFVVPDQMTRVLGDRKRLMQILSNLLSNAFKYAQTGGHVAVAVNRDDNGVHLIVSDDGMGISASEMSKIFEKFYQVENQVTRSKGGTGLGLAITKELVSLHGGRIWVESEEGKGCAFHVALPAAD